MKRTSASVWWALCLGLLTSTTVLAGGVRTASPLPGDHVVFRYHDGSVGVMRGDVQVRPGEHALEPLKLGAELAHWTQRVLVDVDPAMAVRVADVLRSKGWRVVRPLGVKGWTLVDVKQATQADVEAVLRHLTGVRGWHLDAMRQLDVRQMAPSYFDLQWHLRNTNQRPDLQMSAGADVNVVPVWNNVTLGSRDTVIAVIDSGQDLGHAEFDDVDGLGPKVVAPFNPLDGSADPAPDSEDDFDPNSAHGIACAGLATANAFNGGVVGVCPECALMPIRIFSGAGFSTDTAAVDAFVHAIDSGADVISNSWGFGGGAAPPPLLDAFDRAVTEGRDGQGTVILFALGNSYEEAVAFEVANDPRVLAIGGTGADDVRVAYSTFGSSLDLMAPTGHDIDDGNGGVLLRGPQLVTTDRPGDLGYNPFLDPFIDEEWDVDTEFTVVMSGTSGACPIAAGAAGILVSLDPTLSHAQVFDLLRRGADQVGPEPYVNGRNDFYGHGRVNVEASVDLLQNGDVCTPIAEACNNNVDDDCDGAVDGDDTDCGFTLPAPVIDYGPCSVFSPDQCGDGFCLTPEIDAGEDGMCSAVCAGGGNCGDEAACVLFAMFGEEVPLCMPTCDSDDDCEDGFLCTSVDDTAVCAFRCEVSCPVGSDGCASDLGHCGNVEPQPEPQPEEPEPQPEEPEPQPEEPEPQPDAEPGAEPGVDGGNPFVRRPPPPRVHLKPVSCDATGGELWVFGLFTLLPLWRRRRRSAL